MAYLLSDEELRQKLEFYGEKVGPVTTTTRRPLEKKLDSILSKKNRTLNALSSDESDFEPRGSSEKATNKKKRHNHRSSHIPPFPQPLAGRSASPREEIFKKPLSSSPRYPGRSMLSVLPHGSKSGAESRASWQSRRSLGKFDPEVSDSDESGSASPARTLKQRNRNASNHVLRNSSDGALKRSQRHFSPSVTNGEDFPKAARSIDQRDKEMPIRVPETSCSPTSLSERKYGKDCNANGFLISDSLNGMFSSTSKTTKTTNYSICVSWLLVLVTMAFFIFLGIFYMSAVQKTHFTASKKKLETLICKNESSKDCIPQKYFNHTLFVSRNLHSMLSSVAGEYECHYGRESRNLTYAVTKRNLEASLSNYDVDFELSTDKALKYAILLFLKNPDWGISILSSSGKQLSDESAESVVQYVSALESKHASKPFWCRVKHSIHWTLSRLLLMITSVAAVCLGFLSLRYWKKQKDMEEKEFYELVERILDVLQTSDESGPSSSYANSALPSKAVAHLRDTIIPVKERRAKQHLWEKAVAFIEDNESRVQVDYERIGGEDFKVWRWLPSPMSEIEEGKKGKVWQGQAFGSLSKGKNHIPHSPTPCLKIRNMFDSEVEYGDDWQICIRDAILEKCEGNNGIVHIAVDVSSKEGCVYMLCDCPESAGKAYNALHGWWFDGKLVTVKYLRLERYLMRFPEAEDCDEPLKPSNNKRLSLSTPFFSSALERS